MRLKVIQRFLQLESASGIILFAAAVIAFILSNSFLSEIYQHLFQIPLEIKVGQFELNKPIIFWINEGLMTVFFLLVGIELKREFKEGELSNRSQIILPGLAALGGMIIPGLIYATINYNNAIALKGWAVPVATDIAFALGVLSLLGKRVPLSLKIFLMSLAIFDDVGAIIIIAVFHTQSLSYISLIMAGLVIIALQILNWLKIRSLAPYLLLGIVLWICVLQSGVHATVAGVLLAFMIPMQRDHAEEKTSLHRLEDGLHPWVAYFVMPLFAFANAGLSVAGVTRSMLFDSVTWGVILGLFLGKQIGVFIFVWIFQKIKWVHLPENVRWKEVYGVAVLCGIGFTMSLFLGTLAFQGQNKFLIEVQMGVLIASLLSGLVGFILLHCVLPRSKESIETR